MAKLYEKNLGVAESQKLTQAKENEIKNTLESYNSMCGTGKTEIFVFNNVDKDGNLFSNRKGIRFVLPNKDILSNGKGTNLYYRSKLIGREYTVAVRSVDMENRIVYLSARSALADMRHELLADIRVAMRTRQAMVMAARIRKFDDQKGYALVDLFGCGVMAVIPKSMWCKHYINRFGDDNIKVGDVIECSLTYRIRKLDEFNGRIAYVCSRADVLDNPYEGLSERYHVGDIVVLKPTQLMAHNFFAKVDGEDEIEVYCSYPGDRYFGAKAKNVRITLGHYYAAYVTEVNEKERRFRAKVYTETTVAGEKVANITKEQIRRSIAESILDPNELEIKSNDEVPEASDFTGIE